MDGKKAAGEKAAEYISDGMRIGLGTGSTVYWTILRIGELVKEGLRIEAVPTSVQTEKLAREAGIPLIPLAQLQAPLDLTVDGADEVSPKDELIKGGGGALLREKMIASFSDRFIVVVDHSKCVPELGRFPLPVEVVPFGWEITSKQLGQLGCEPVLRMRDGAPFVTDNGNYVIDCRFGSIPNAGELSVELNKLPGVVENGLFVNMADLIVVGHPDGTVRTKSGS
ncbi:ribose-5-phosphate isomerase RpiA [Paenibacillus sp. MZ04-78.2]|uniref:ribose-5-phosphate isomerase RpiA n=1 Tax=Paenibacillus sp. MZ04-78.2 TaxID=2962034 RepID=UPI0020B64539|nr:ribose-5-phosphate isomerase RpiA [Paenibacillus sp. MZ04-78.2]MCP3776289.1 ribose-5-phosphate isomerase RpiA [Paenibacillus sp. MZ04-78.2]